MGELRKDYILDRWVEISEKRKKRPHEYKEKAPAIVEKTDYFAPGNENLTPAEIGRIGGEKWQMRWFANKFPAVAPQGNPNIETHDKFFTFSSNYGYHEILVETPGNKQLPELGVAEIITLLKVYANRIVGLEKKPHVKYVNVFKNEGFKGGTSILHSHSQIIAVNVIPLFIQDKLNAVKKYVSCPYCDVVKIESAGTRKCFENNDFLAFCPYAPRYNFEAWIMPKKHITRLEDVNFKALAELLKKILVKIHGLKVSYNIIIHYSPKGKDLHLAIEILPRIAIWAGFELCSGIIINSVSPEHAAEYYRGDYS